MERYSLGQSLRIYWPNALAVFLTPTLSMLMIGFVEQLTPIVFGGLIIFGVIVPYHFGKAPTAYAAIAAPGLFLLGIFLLMAIGLAGAAFVGTL